MCRHVLFEKSDADRDNETQEEDSDDGNNRGSDVIVDWQSETDIFWEKCSRKFEF